MRNFFFLILKSQRHIHNVYENDDDKSIESSYYRKDLYACFFKSY